MNDLWKEACKVYGNNDDGKMIYTRKDKDSSISINNAISFGPWVLWKKGDWNDIAYGFKKWKRLQKKNKGEDSQIAVV